MHDPMLEEIWRVREELINRHGGVHGYLKDLQALDRERIRKKKRKRTSKKTMHAAKNGRVTRRKAAMV